MGNNLPVRASLSFGLGFGKDAGRRTVALRVEDPESGMIIVDIEMNEHQFLEFISGGSARVETSWGSYMDRIGKTMEHKQVTLEPSVFKSTADAEAAAESWRTANAWETVEVRRNNNSNWVFIGRRWVAAAKER